MPAAVITARTTDDGVTHRVTHEWDAFPWVACGASLTWRTNPAFRLAERHEDREVDCMACIAAFL